MRTVPNWKALWRTYSVQAMAAGALLQASWALLLTTFAEELKVWSPWVAGLTASLLIGGIIGRGIAQDLTPPKE